MNRISLGTLIFIAAFLLLGSVGAAHAAESYDNCTGFITSVPTTITTQGTWCLKQDLATAITTGDAITINTNNVTIDCNDFKLGGLAAGLATQTIGIYGLNRLNTTVRHCNIRGFLYGMNLDGGGGHLVEDNRFDGNTFAGARVAGEGSILQRNRVFDTGGSTAPSYTAAYGLRTVYASDLLDNTVTNVLATSGGNGSSIGIYTFDNTSGSIADNRIRGVTADGTGTAYGIFNENGSYTSTTRNHVTNAAGSGTTGVYCDSTSGSASGNVITGFTVNISGCSDDGGNILKP